MLLVNYVSKVVRMSGSVGTVVDICSPNQGRCDSDDDSHYVVVDFKECTIPEEQKHIQGHPRTWVPIPVFTTRCNKNAVQYTQSHSEHSSQ